MTSRIISTLLPYLLRGLPNAVCEIESKDEFDGHVPLEAVEDGHQSQSVYLPTMTRDSAQACQQT